VGWSEFWRQPPSFGSALSRESTVEPLDLNVPNRSVRYVPVPMPKAIASPIYEEEGRALSPQYNSHKIYSTQLYSIKCTCYFEPKSYSKIGKRRGCWKGAHIGDPSGNIVHTVAHDKDTRQQAVCLPWMNESRKKSQPDPYGTVQVLRNHKAKVCIEPREMTRSLTHLRLEEVESGMTRRTLKR
jgi:hypothetical protein